MPVSGVIVICEESTVEEVHNRIDSHPRLEVREAGGVSLIVVTDTATVKEDRADVDWISKLPGVLSTYVAFTNTEDVAESVAGLASRLAPDSPRAATAAQSQGEQP
jgi:nitrate reductase NapAB chaperone NapD